MHVMIDLETLSLRPDAAIIQIAAVEFEARHAGAIQVDSMLSVLVDPAGQERHVDRDTLDFWEEQRSLGNSLLSDAALGAGVPLWRALEATILWFRDREDVEGVWSHGAAFDLPILRHAFMAQGHSDCPWNYRLCRDTRTLYFARATSRYLRDQVEPTDKKQLHEAVEEVLSVPFQEHNAAHDAVLQCLQVQEVMP